MNATHAHGTSDLADSLWREGLQCQLDGDLDAAVGLYRASLAVVETAEAWCFLGWCLSFKGELDLAVSYCRRAIDIDPQLGNPYNELGAYLVELERDEEAEEWFLRAKDAPRYETRQFPFLNLARLYISRGLLTDALIELQAARVLAPADDRIGELISYVGILVEARQPTAA